MTKVRLRKWRRPKKAPSTQRSAFRRLGKRQERQRRMRYHLATTSLRSRKARSATRRHRLREIGCRSCTRQRLRRRLRLRPTRRRPALHKMRAGPATTSSARLHQAQVTLGQQTHQIPSWARSCLEAQTCSEASHPLSEPLRLRSASNLRSLPRRSLKYGIGLPPPTSRRVPCRRPSQRRNRRAWLGPMGRLRHTSHPH